ncbi:MAG: hypothetical protein QF664_06065 [Dehalococcoidia bacterium]|nr:hypothetical protein [Dehalococcoidia bacterium]
MRPAPAAAALLAILSLAVFGVACSGGGDQAANSGGVTAAGSATATPEPAATSSLLVRPSSDAPVPSARTATPELAATAQRTAVPGCSREPPAPPAPPAIYYGFGLDEGELVTTFNTRAGCEQVLCEQSPVNGDGFWVVRIAGDSVCGVQDGDTIVFAVNGERVDHAESWVSGGVPADVARGIALR